MCSSDLISYDEKERRQLLTDTHPVLINAFVNRIRVMEKEIDNAHAHITADGYAVLQITKDANKRNIAILQRPQDFVVAVGYDTRDGTWKQGFYDFETQKQAEEFMEKNYGQQTKTQTPKLKATVSGAAVIRAYNDHLFARMPNSVDRKSVV